ncbi:ATP-binding cassette domain-containing protein [Burkholderia cepacia]|uniref:ATP-binding cassette domain-containing protein n=1 Tax=Burkholderia cepacia TaxID=292 RepID=UPI000F57CBE6|nr:ATP-binding cassette domain-containing protein [Burkholderia cepacia]MCA8322577.1 ATP-binding cassette domain-containing protein [Burkholderia cepacia]RQT78099.1 ATP-binding cassette domain-containing protein [Burkholderia cepacia]
MLRFSSIVAGYGDTMVLKGISGEVAAGSVLGVFGSNGVGKSTLMLIDEPSEGVQQENLERMASVIRSRIEEGAAFVVVEQNLTFLTSIADHFIGLDHGEVVLSGDSIDVSRDRLEAVLAV